MSNNISNKNIAIIIGSSRKNGNTERLVKAVDFGAEAKVYNLLDFDINYYDYKNRYQNDDFIDLMDKISLNHDHIIFATPVYWYSMSAIMKCFLDRFTDLISVRKDIGRRLRSKKLSLISCSNDDDLNSGFAEPFKLSADYLGMEFISHLHGWLDDEALPTQLKNKVISFKKAVYS